MPIPLPESVAKAYKNVKLADMDTAFKSTSSNADWYSLQQDVNPDKYLLSKNDVVNDGDTLNNMRFVGFDTFESAQGDRNTKAKKLDSIGIGLDKQKELGLAGKTALKDYIQKHAGETIDRTGVDVFGRQLLNSPQLAEHMISEGVAVPTDRYNIKLQTLYRNAQEKIQKLDPSRGKAMEIQREYNIDRQDPGFLSSVLQSPKVLGAASTRLVGDVGDFVADVVTPGDSHLFDSMKDTEKTNKFFGVDDRESNFRQAEAVHQFRQGNYGKALAQGGAVLPELLAESAPTIASYFVPVMGEAKFAVTADKFYNVFKGIEGGKDAIALAKSSRILTDAEKAMGKTTKLTKAEEFVRGNTGGFMLNVGAQTNQDIEERTKNNNGVEPSASDIAIMTANNIVQMGTDKFIDFNILKGTSLSGKVVDTIKNAAKVIPEEGWKGIGVNLLKNGTKLAATMGEEGAQEYYQQWSQILNQKLNTTKYGNLENLINNKEVQDEAIAAGVMGAAMGGGMAAPTTIYKTAKDLSNTDTVQNTINAIKGSKETGAITPQEEKTGIKGSVDETAVTPHFTEEHANVLDKASQENDFGTYKATMKDIITNAQKSPETYGQVMKQLDPYIKEFGRMQANLAKQYEETGSVDNVKLGAEPSDTLLGTLHYIRDDKKAEEFADKVRQMKEFRDQYDGNDEEINRIINDTLEQRKELKTLLEARQSVAHEGFNDEREGYLSYYQEAKNGNVTAKSRLGYFADIHAKKADTLKAQREEVLNNKADELHNFTREANAAGINVSEQEMLTALLAKNGKLEGRITKGETPITIEKFNQLKDHFGNRLDTTDIKSGSQKNTIDLKYWESKSGRNDGVFELNPSDAWSELALTRYGDVFSGITKPSGLNDTINSVDREVKTMKNLLNRLDRSNVQEKMEEPTDALEKDSIEAEEIASKEKEPTTIETVKETARPEPTKKEKRKAKKEAARKEDYDKEKEQIELEQQQAKEQEPKTIETVEEGKKAPMPKKSSVFVEARKVMDTKYFDGLLEQVQRQDGEDNVSYVQRLIKLVRNAAELRSKQSGANADYKLGMLNEVINRAKEQAREVRSQEEKEINELKEDLKQAKELGKTARVEMAALSKMYEMQGKTLQLFKLVSKDEATQKLIDERNRIVKELKNKERGLKTSITIMRNFLDSRMEDRDRSAKNFKQAMLEKLDSIYAHAGYTYPSKVMSLSKMMQSFLKMIWLDKTQVGKKIDHFLKKLEGSLIDISKLREDLSKTNKELSKYIGSRIGEAQAKEREVMKQLGETDAKYTKVLIEGMALGAQKKDSTFKYGIKGVSNDIMEYQDGETSKQYEARVRKALGSKIPANIASKIKQNVLHIDGLIRQHEMTVTNELLDTKKVNSDFARYDVAFNSNPEFVKEVNKFAKVIESIIPEIKDVAEAGRLSEDYARGLVMQADGTIDRNMAGAMLASVLDELKNNSKYMTMTTKDIAAMYGLDEVEVGGDMKQRLDQIGVPAKYMAAHMGDMITDLMGIKMKEGADSSVYRDFKASLGNMAMYAAQQAGYVSVNAVKNAELADIFEIPANESEAVGYYIKQKPGIIDKIKEKHSLLNDTLIIPSNKKGVRFNKRNFDKDECAQ